MKMCIWLLLLLSMTINCGGCINAASGTQAARKNAAIPSTPVLIEQIATTAADAHKALQEARTTVSAMTPANVESQKPVAVVQITHADDAVQKIPQAAADAKKAAVADANTIDKQDKKITSLEAKDPVKTWLVLATIGCILLGGGMVIASICITALAGITWLRSVGVALIALGLFVGTIAYFLTALRWIVLACVLAALLAGGVWLWLHRKILAAKFGDQEPAVPAIPLIPRVSPLPPPTPAAPTA